MIKQIYYDSCIVAFGIKYTKCIISKSKVLMLQIECLTLYTYITFMSGGQNEKKVNIDTFSFYACIPNVCICRQYV